MAQEIMVRLAHCGEFDCGFDGCETETEDRATVDMYRAMLRDHIEGALIEAYPEAAVDVDYRAAGDTNQDALITASDDDEEPSDYTYQDEVREYVSGLMDGCFDVFAAACDKMRQNIFLKN
jgi:hypothetical protein